MIEAMRARSGWTCRVAVALLVWLGAGLISVVWPEESQATGGYYDGDDDDAATTPEPSPSFVPSAVTRSPLARPILASALAVLRADPVSPPAPGRSQPPPLRSPPA
jgi:hypothetical protein